jgi:hypothetical protein
MPKQSYKKFLYPAVLAIPFLFVGAIFGSTFFASTSTTPVISGNVINYHSDVCVIVDKASGEEQTVECLNNPNFFTPEGKNAVMDKVGVGSSSTAFSQIALCNISTATGGAGVNQCYVAGGLTNATGTFLKVSNPGNWSISSTFTATGDGLTVNGTGLLNGSTTGAVFFANNSFTQVTLNTNDQITIRWNISIQ